VSEEKEPGSHQMAGGYRGSFRCLPNGARISCGDWSAC